MVFQSYGAVCYQFFTIISAQVVNNSQSTANLVYFWYTLLQIRDFKPNICYCEKLERLEMELN